MGVCGFVDKQKQKVTRRTGDRRNRGSEQPLGEANVFLPLPFFPALHAAKVFVYLASVNGLDS